MATTRPAPPPINPITGRYEVSPTRDWVKCPTCGHLAYRSGPHEWTCTCADLPRVCHGYGNVHDADGVPQLVRRSYVIREEGH